MRHPIFSHLATTTTMPPSSPFSTKPRKPSSSSSAAVNHHHRHHHHSLSATATLDLLVVILVLFSGTFLLTSYFSYIFNSLSLLLPPLLHHHFPLPYLLGFLIFFFFTVVTFFFFTHGGGGFFRLRSRRCGNPKCKGLKMAMEFDLQLQTEECLKSSRNEIDRLPWKGGNENNPDYECLRVELCKMAPTNGRAVLLFRAKCGCPVAKLIGWGPKKGRKHKNSQAGSIPFSLILYAVFLPSMCGPDGKAQTQRKFLMVSEPARLPRSLANGAAN